MTTQWPDDALRRIRELTAFVKLFLIENPQDAQILIFNGTVFVPVTMSGDATITHDGVVTVTGASAFPITFDDGTFTYTIEVASNSLKLSAFTNANPTDAISSIFLEGPGNLDLNAGSGAVNKDVNVSATRDVNVTPGRDFGVNATGQAYLSAGTTVDLDAVGNININAGGNLNLGDSTTDVVTVAPNGDVELVPIGGSSDSVKIGTASNKVGFHAVTPVAQAAHPSTLGDVITLLTALGLCA